MGSARPRTTVPNRRLTSSRQPVQQVLSGRASMAEEWLTYAELGRRLGISAAAARHRVSRMNLRRQVGNDGRARVLVDLAELEFNPPQAPAERQPSARSAAVERLDEVLREQVAFLQAELIQERSRSAE